MTNCGQKMLFNHFSSPIYPFPTIITRALNKHSLQCFSITIFVVSGIGSDKGWNTSPKSQFTLQNFILFSLLLNSSSLFFMTQHRLVDQGLPMIGALRSYSDTPHTQDSSGQEISPSQRPVPNSTSPTRDRHTCYLWDSNSPSQQVSSSRHMTFSILLINIMHKFYTQLVNNCINFA
jgi:hypothetical protein